MASKLIVILSFAFVGVLGGCSKWPPYEQELKSQFLENREEFELLVRELQDSKYTGVNTSIGGDIFARYFEGEKWAEGPVPDEQPKDQIKWQRLFSSTGVDNISETYEGDFVLGLDIFYLGSKKKAAFISYVNSTTIQTKFRQCLSDFAKSDCGNCIVQIEGDWWIRYGWEPITFTDELYDKSALGNWTADEFGSKLREAYEACLVEGGTLLGGENEQ